MTKYVDVAKWQGNINWNAVKAAGVDGAVLKIIDKSNKVESAFERNYKECSLLGLFIDVYNYTYTSTVESAIASANGVIKVLNGRKIAGKVWMDVEDECMKNLGSRLPKIINAYKDVIKKAGYDFGVYTGLAFYNSYIKPYASQIQCEFWIARYPSNNQMTINENPAVSKKPSISHPLWGWQYTSKGKINGISGNADISIVYAKTELGSTSVAANPYNEPTYTLYKGKLLMSKEYVMWLQYELNEMGYGLAIDGSFGNKTKEALISAQKKLNLTADGKCGILTRAALKNM